MALIACTLCVAGAEHAAASAAIVSAHNVEVGDDARTAASAKFLAALPVALPNAPSGSVQVVEPITSGMRITTSNSVASVEFRVRSSGPGYCIVRVWSSYGRENALNAPSTWSPWLQLFSHSGSVTTIIGVDPGCARDAAFEIRYQKDVP